MQRRHVHLKITHIHSLCKSERIVVREDAIQRRSHDPTPFSEPVETDSWKRCRINGATLDGVVVHDDSLGRALGMDVAGQIERIIQRVT